MSRAICCKAIVLSGGRRSPGVAVPSAGVDSIRTGGAALRSGERHDEIPHRFVLFLLQPGAGCRNEFFIYLISDELRHGVVSVLHPAFYSAKRAVIRNIDYLCVMIKTLHKSDSVL